jgi:hypothetical protein
MSESRVRRKNKIRRKGKPMPDIPKRTAKLLDSIVGSNLPRKAIVTVRQMLFVRALFLGKTLKEANDGAGYAVVNSTNKLYHDSNYRARLKTQGVQYMIKLTMADWCSQNQIDGNKLADMTLECYENATTVRDQLMALKLLASYIGVSTISPQMQ